MRLQIILNDPYVNVPTNTICMITLKDKEIRCISDAHLIETIALKFLSTVKNYYRTFSNNAHEQIVLKNMSKSLRFCELGVVYMLDKQTENP